MTGRANCRSDAGKAEIGRLEHDQRCAPFARAERRKLVRNVGKPVCVRRRLSNPNRAPNANPEGFRGKSRKDAKTQPKELNRVRLRHPPSLKLRRTGGYGGQGFRGLRILHQRPIGKQIPVEWDWGARGIAARVSPIPSPHSVRWVFPITVGRRLAQKSSLPLAGLLQLVHFFGSDHVQGSGSPRGQSPYSLAGALCLPVPQALGSVRFVMSAPAIATRPDHLLPRGDSHPLAYLRSKAAQEMFRL